MALQITSPIALPSGISIATAYARVDAVNGSKSGISFTLNYYLSQEAFLEGRAYVLQEVYSFEPSVDVGSKNFISQAYEYLKTLEAFEFAKDA